MTCLFGFGLFGNSGRSVAVLLCGVGLGLVWPSAVPAQQWNLYTPNPTAITAVKEMQALAEDLEKKTNGEVKIRIHLGGTLQIQAPDIAQAVSDGVVQIGDDQQFSGSVPIGGLVRLPSLLRTPGEYEKAAEILLPYVQTAYNKYDVTVLGTYYYPPLVLFSREKLTSLAELKGQKIRTLSPESSEWVRRFGGLPVTLAFPELASALDRGVVTGVTTASAGAGYVLRDQFKYNYRIPIAFSNVFVIANNAALKKLSPNAQAAVRSGFRDTLAATSRKILAEEDDLTKKMAAGGITVTESSAGDLAAVEKAMETYWGAWARERGPAAIEALAKIRTAIGR